MNQFLVSVSGMFEAEGFHPSGATGLDFRELEGTCCYCSEEAAKIFSKALKEPEGIAWIDSGDYHYLSYFRAKRIKQDFEFCSTITATTSTFVGICPAATGLRPFRSKADAG